MPATRNFCMKFKFNELAYFFESKGPAPHEFLNSKIKHRKQATIVNAHEEEVKTIARNINNRCDKGRA